MLLCCLLNIFVYPHRHGLFSALDGEDSFHGGQQPKERWIANEFLKTREQVLSPKCDIYNCTTANAQRTLWKRKQKERESQEGSRLWNAVFSLWLVRCIHELIAAVATYTRSSQPSFQNRWGRYFPAWLYSDKLLSVGSYYGRKNYSLLTICRFLIVTVDSLHPYICWQHWGISTWVILKKKKDTRLGKVIW